MRTLFTSKKAAGFVLLVVSLLSSCGDAPPGGGGSVIIFQPSTLNITAGGGATRQPISVRVATNDNQSMNDVEVTISGNWADPFIPALYHFYDVNNNLLLSPFKAKTDKYGMINFYIRIPDYMSTHLPQPTIVSASTVTGGGSLPPGTYSYSVTALAGLGQETNGSVIVTATTTTVGGVEIIWSAIPGAAGYNIYGRTAPEELIFTSTSAATRWTDDGQSMQQATITVPVTNTTSTILQNAFTTNIEARAGAVYNSMEIKYQ